MSVITPLDIQNVEFRTSFRGYDQSEVDSFLNKVSTDYEKIYKENQIIQEEIRDLKKDIGKYKNIEGSISNTLILAQETANTTRENAEREAMSIIQEADMKVKTMLEDAQAQIKEKEKQLYNLNSHFKNYKLQMLTFLETQYSMLKDDELVAPLQKNENIAAEQFEDFTDNGQSVDYQHFISGGQQSIDYEQHTINAENISAEQIEQFEELTDNRKSPSYQHFISGGRQSMDYEQHIVNDEQSADYGQSDGNSEPSR